MQLKLNNKLAVSVGVGVGAFNKEKQAFLQYCVSITVSKSLLLPTLDMAMQLGIILLSSMM